MVVSNCIPGLPLKDGAGKKMKFFVLQTSGLKKNKNMDSRQQRLNQRYALTDQSVHARMALASRVKILDISLGGLSLEADKRLNIGREYTLHIEYEGKKVAIKGSIMWSVLTESQGDNKGNAIPIYRAGMKFSHIPKDLSGMIDCIKQKHHEGEQRTGEEAYHLSISVVGAMEIPGQDQEYFTDHLSQAYP